MEIITWLDDHSRYVLHICAHARITAPIVLTTLSKAAGQYGYPASTLTDNGMVYTVRYSGGRGGRNAFEKQLRDWHVIQKNSRPTTPPPAAKHRALSTDDEEMAARPAGTADHHHRVTGPARSVHLRVQPATTAPVPAAPRDTGRHLHRTPKATPNADRSSDTHDRVRRDKISKAGTVTLRVAGRLRHIGVGRTYAGTCVILLVQDLHVRIVNAATGELLEPVIDPRRDYQPKNTPPNS